MIRELCVQESLHLEICPLMNTKPKNPMNARTKETNKFLQIKEFSLVTGIQCIF